MEEATVGIFLANQEGRSVEANQHAREMLGYTQEELLSLSIPDLIPSEDLQAAPPRLDELRKGKTVISQRRLRHKNGMLVPVELRVRMLTDGRLLAIVEDLKTIHALLNALPDSALLITPEGETLTMNQVAAQRLGVKVEELLGRPIWESFPPTLAAARRVKVEEVVRTGQPVTFQDERDGRSFETRLYPMADAFGQVRRVAVFARDISRQKQAEAALRENERLFRIAIGTLDIAVFRQDLDLRYTWIYQPQLGYSPTQVVGKTDAELLPAADAVRVMAIKRRVLETRVGCREGVTVTSNSVSRYFELNLEPLQGDDGKVVGLLGATLDITAHKQVEEQLRASLQEKEVLLREIHHRVKNNLQIISSLLYLQAQKTDNQGLRNMLQESRNRIVSMSLIHEKLYQVTDLARITFTDYARELAQALFRSYGVNQANVALTIKGNDLTLDINRAVPCGLIINEVVSNSLKYAFPKGRRGAIRLALRLDQAQQCHFILSDNGVGMPQDFESRPRSSLGLTLIERLAEQLQGTLERSSSAQGTTYRLTFPREV
jgi:PAS domain S-box-containing protein